MSLQGQNHQEKKNKNPILRGTFINIDIKPHTLSYSKAIPPSYEAALLCISKYIIYSQTFIC